MALFVFAVQFLGDIELG